MRSINSSAPDRHPAFRDRSRLHFDTLTHAEQLAAVCRLADAGMSDYGIAAATRLSVEMIRGILAKRSAA